MKKIKRLIPIIGILLPLSLSATDYPWLTFKMKDNTEVSVAADNLSLNYSDENLFLKSATVDENFAVSKILSMRFTSSPAGIDDLTVNQEEAAEYFTVSGVRVGHYLSVDAARRELKPGIYLVKTNAKTFKVIF